MALLGGKQNKTTTRASLIGWFVCLVCIDDEHVPPPRGRGRGRGRDHTAAWIATRPLIPLHLPLIGNSCPKVCGRKCPTRRGRVSKPRL